MYPDLSVTRSRIIEGKSLQRIEGIFARKRGCCYTDYALTMPLAATCSESALMVCT